jgi:cytochrome c oxidase subunit III
MEIPHTVQARPDTGLYNAKLGIWLFLASEVMLFGALFSSYILLRVGAHEWPRGEELGVSVPIGTVNTILLITSSITMILGWSSLVMKQFARFKLWMGVTILLGIIFLAVKGVEYAAKFQAGHFPRSDMFLGLYFTLTGIHALHLIGGTIVNLYLWGPGSKMWFTQPQRFTNRIEVAGLYWHFVDLVWLFVFPTFYLF